MLQYHVPSYDMWYCMILMLHLNISSCEHVYDIASGDAAQWCNTILWILFILMRTWLSWLIFHSLESTFSDGMHRQGLLQFIQHTRELAKLLWHPPIFLSFGRHQKTSQMFSKSQQKRQVLGDLGVCTGFGLKKNSIAEIFGLFCLLAVFDPNPN